MHSAVRAVANNLAQAKTVIVCLMMLNMTILALKHELRDACCSLSSVMLFVAINEHLRQLRVVYDLCNAWHATLVDARAQLHSQTPRSLLCGSSSLVRRDRWWPHSMTAKRRTPRRAASERRVQVLAAVDGRARRCRPGCATARGLLARSAPSIPTHVSQRVTANVLH